MDLHVCYLAVACAIFLWVLVARFCPSRPATKMKQMECEEAGRAYGERQRRRQRQQRRRQQQQPQREDDVDEEQGGGEGEEETIEEAREQLNQADFSDTILYFRGPTLQIDQRGDVWGHLQRFGLIAKPLSQVLTKLCQSAVHLRDRPAFCELTRCLSQSGYCTELEGVRDHVIHSHRSVRGLERALVRVGSCFLEDGLIMAICREVQLGKARHEPVVEVAFASIVSPDLEHPQILFGQVHATLAYEKEEKTVQSASYSYSKFVLHKAGEGEKALTRVLWQEKSA